MSIKFKKIFNKNIKKIIYLLAYLLKNLINNYTNIVIRRKKNNVIINEELILEGVTDRKSAFLELAINRELLKGWNHLVQIGAGGPEHADLLENFVIKYKLESIFIDGDEDSLKRKKDRLFNHKIESSKYIQRWISAETNESYLYKFEDQNDNLSGLTSLSKKSFDKHSKLIANEKVLIEKVETLGIIELKDKFFNKEISLFALDCEGLDYEILMTLLNNNFYPNIIVVEILSLDEKEIENIRNKLLKNKYLIYPDISDLIAVKI